MRYANAAERPLAAIGEPQMIDTAKDARLEFVARMAGRGYTERQVRGSSNGICA
jgi:predicted Ser/Thr protein kinase